MPPRLDLQTKLEEVLGSDYVYFQPPPSIQMVYPCIVYKLSDMETRFADNNPYSHEKRYTVTVIDKNPDSLIPDKIAALPKSNFDRAYFADNLNHYVFNIYF